MHVKRRLDELRQDIRQDPGLDIRRRRSRGINQADNVLHLRASEAGARAVVSVLSSAHLPVGVLGLILIDTSANALGIGVVAASARRGTQPAA